MLSGQLLRSTTALIGQMGSFIRAPQQSSPERKQVTNHRRESLLDSVGPDELPHLAALSNVEEMLKSSNEPDPKALQQLMHVLYKINDWRPSLFSTILSHACLLEEWLLSHNQMTLSNPNDRLRLAKRHLSLWRRQGIASDDYHFQRARELLREHFGDHDEWDVVDDWVEFAQALMYEGQYDHALHILLDKVIPKRNDSNKHADDLFFVGVAYKALRERERANHYFFESVQAGCPRGFGEIDLMTIVSRTLEEAEVDETDATYQTVYAHIRADGTLPPDMDYDDWLSDGRTWTQLGEKCSAQHMHALAAEFFSLSISRDEEAFRKPRLWLQFAKACRLCGRDIDGRLAIKQALSKAPNNAQLLRAQKNWNSPQEHLRSMSDETAPIRPLLESIQKQLERARELPLLKLQALVRGLLVRRDLMLGFAPRLASGENASMSPSTHGLYSQELIKRMTARCGALVVLPTASVNLGKSVSESKDRNGDVHNRIIESGEAVSESVDSVSEHKTLAKGMMKANSSTQIIPPPSDSVIPLLIEARCSLRGSVSSLTLLDVSRDERVKVRLAVPFSPSIDELAKRSLSLSIVCETFLLPVNRIEVIGNQETVIQRMEERPVITLTFTDALTGNYSFRKLVLSLRSQALDGIIEPEQDDEQLQLVTDINDPILEQPKVNASSQQSTQRLRSHSIVFDMAQEAFVNVHSLFPTTDVEEEKSNGVVSRTASVARLDRQGTQSRLEHISLTDDHSIFSTGALNANNPSGKLIHQQSSSVLSIASVPSLNAHSQQISVTGNPQVHLYSTAAPTTFTNELVRELTRCVLHFQESFYLVRVRNEYDYTLISLTNCSLCQSERMILFILTREHVDRSTRLSRHVVKLLNVLWSSSRLRHFLNPNIPMTELADNFVDNLSLGGEMSIANSSLTNSHHPLDETQSQSQMQLSPEILLSHEEIHCRARLLLQDSLLICDCQHDRGLPMIGDSLEVVLLPPEQAQQNDHLLTELEEDERDNWTERDLLMEKDIDASQLTGTVVDEIEDELLDPQVSTSLRASDDIHAPMSIQAIAPSHGFLSAVEEAPTAATITEASVFSQVSNSAAKVESNTNSVILSSLAAAENAFESQRERARRQTEFLLTQTSVASGRGHTKSDADVYDQAFSAISSAQGSARSTFSHAQRTRALSMSMFERLADRNGKPTADSSYNNNNNSSSNNSYCSSANISVVGRLFGDQERQWLNQRANRFDSFAYALSEVQSIVESTTQDLIATVDRRVKLSQWTHRLISNASALAQERLLMDEEDRCPQWRELQLTEERQRIRTKVVNSIARQTCDVDIAMGLDSVVIQNVSVYLRLCEEQSQSTVHTVMHIALPLCLETALRIEKDNEARERQEMFAADEEERKRELAHAQWLVECENNRVLQQQIDVQEGHIEDDVHNETLRQERKPFYFAHKLRSQVTAASAASILATGLSTTSTTSILSLQSFQSMQHSADLTGGARPSSMSGKRRQPLCRSDHIVLRSQSARQRESVRQQDVVTCLARGDHSSLVSSQEGHAAAFSLLTRPQTASGVLINSMLNATDLKASLRRGGADGGGGGDDYLDLALSSNKKSSRSRSRSDVEEYGSEDEEDEVTEAQELLEYRKRHNKQPQQSSRLSESVYEERLQMNRLFLPVSETSAQMLRRQQDDAKRSQTVLNSVLLEEFALMDKIAAESTVRPITAARAAQDKGKGKGKGKKPMPTASAIASAAAGGATTKPSTSPQRKPSAKSTSMRQSEMLSSELMELSFREAREFGYISRDGNRSKPTAAAADGHSPQHSNSQMAFVIHWQKKLRDFLSKHANPSADTARHSLSQTASWISVAESAQSDQRQSSTLDPTLNREPFGLLRKDLNVLAKALSVSLSQSIFSQRTTALSHAVSVQMFNPLQLLQQAKEEQAQAEETQQRIRKAANWTNDKLKHMAAKQRDLFLAKKQQREFASQEDRQKQQEVDMLKEEEEDLQRQRQRELAWENWQRDQRERKRQESCVLTTDEMIIALAETSNSVGDCVRRVNEEAMHFLTTLRLVSELVDVKALVCEFVGGHDFLVSLSEWERDQERQQRQESVFNANPHAMGTPMRRPATASERPTVEWRESSAVLDELRSKAEERKWLPINSVASKSFANENARNVPRSHIDSFDQEPPMIHESVESKPHKPILRKEGSVGARGMGMLSRQSSARVQWTASGDERDPTANASAGVGKDKDPRRSTGLMVLPTVPVPQSHPMGLSKRSPFVFLRGSIALLPNSASNTADGPPTYDEPSEGAPVPATVADNDDTVDENGLDRRQREMIERLTSSFKPPREGLLNTRMSFHTTDLPIVLPFPDNAPQHVVRESKQNARHAALQRANSLGPKPRSSSATLHVGFQDSVELNESFANENSFTFPIDEEERDVLQASTTQLQPQSSSANNANKAPMLRKQRSVRMSSAINDAMAAEGTQLQVAVLTRNEAIKASRDETILRSDYVHLRAPIERKAALLQRKMEERQLL